MTLDELHDDLSDNVEDSLEKMRREEAETERKFPGYPPYVSEVVLQKIEWTVKRHAEQLHRTLSGMFGYVAMKDVTVEELKYELRELATSVAHQAAGHEAGKACLAQQQASTNMLNGVLAGIALGSKNNTQTEEGTPDASTES
jgi:hypothetical protein